MNLPYLCANVDPIPGRIRSEPEEFRVDELPAYAPEGRGTHLFIQFEKRDFTTQEALRRIARALGVDPRSAGFAGTKDRRAVTTQWASFEGARPEAVAGVELEGIRILAHALHPSKLRTGHLHGNRFTLLLRDVPAERDADVSAVLDRLVAHGMPNYFGEQRFGRDGDNVARAVEWLSGRMPAPRDPFERRMLASSLQSELFNRCVADRVSRGELGRVFHGDLCRKEDTGGLFTAEDVVSEQARADAFAISPTGPMFGPEMRWPNHEARAREEELLAQSGLAPDVLARLGKHAPGTRRVVRVRPGAVSVARVEGGLELAFTLPSGAYATCLVREILKNETATETSQRGDAPPDEGR